MSDIFLGLVGVLAGGIAAVAGFGIGSLLTPVLALQLDTKLAVAAVSVPHLIGTFLRFVRLRQYIDRRVFMNFGLASALGGLIGALLHNALGSPALELVFGALLLFAGVSELSGVATRLQLGGRWSWLAGAASGLFGGLVGNQGGVRSAALLRYQLSREGVVATATAIALLVDGVRIPIYVADASSALLDHWRVIAVAAIGVVIGTLIGARVLLRLPERWFRHAVALLLIGLGVFMLARALGART